MLNTISYDERAKWDKYALTMPISRRDIVLSKYALVLCMAVLGFVLGVIVALLGGGNVLEALGVNAALAGSTVVITMLLDKIGAGLP